MECNHFLRFKVIVTICLKKGMFSGNDSSTTNKKVERPMQKNMMVPVQRIMPRVVDGWTVTHGNKGIRDAGSTADIRMLWPWSALVCLGLL